MSKSDIRKFGTFMPTAIGRSIYVWSSQGLPPYRTGQTECVVSAHGCQALISSVHRKKLPKNITLAYYVPNGCNLNDPGLIEVVTKKVKPIEFVSTNEAKQDYSLSKYQGRHNSITPRPGSPNEDYGHIQTGMHASFRRAVEREKAQVASAQLRKRFANNPNVLQSMTRNVHEAEETMIGDIDEVQMDVVTLRNRRGRWDLTLFQVLAQLYDHGYFYPVVHCDFCRGNYLGQGKLVNAERR